jgi:hypothetical protein
LDVAGGEYDGEHQTQGDVRGEMSVVETYAETPAASTTALKMKDFMFGGLFVCG